MSTFDYVGRTIDVAAFQNFSGDKLVLLRQLLADEGAGGQILTGVIKLAQRFLLELLTESGSMLYLPARGSSFMTEIHVGQINTPGELLGAFSRGLIDVSNSLRAEDAGSSYPLDEQYNDARVISAEFSPGAAILSVQLISQMVGVEIILPVSFVF